VARRSIVTGALLALLAAGCGGRAAPTTTAPPPATAVATTLPATTVSTTTTVPGLAFRGDGAYPEIDVLVESLYRHVYEGTPPPPELPAGLASWIAGAVPAGSASITASTIAADLKYGQRVAVVQAGGDSILVADETAGWKIVGAHLGSVGLEPWFGPPTSSVLIVGSDARWNQDVASSRSDSLHIVTAVPSERAGAIVGIPRDSWVATPSGGNGKITDVLANHGPDGLFDTVQRISGTEISGWIMTGFLGFEVISRGFGPFEIDLPQRVPKSSGFPGFPEGPQVVEPAENLLLLARIRKPLPRGDFDRSFNHGVIMLGALRRVQEMGIEALPELVRILDDSILTSFRAGELLGLAATALLLNPDLVPNVVIPGSVGTTSGGASIVRIGAAADDVFADQADDGLLNGSAG
jgi:anionic cell wall polymer biosynthesis LytR-Cps2A-Psr (LCP) family protein